jgi:hypothetical protein
MRRYLAAVGVAAAVIAGSAFAPQPVAGQQPPVASKEFTAFLSDDPSYGAWLLNRIQTFEPAAMLAECADIKITGRHSFEITDPPIIPRGSAMPQSGSWIEHVDIDRCGTPSRRSLIVAARGLDQLEGQGLMPGETVALPLLQEDTAKVAWPDAAQRLKCDPRQVYPADSRVVGLYAPGAPWREAWTLGGCGRKVTLTIDFKPGEDGTKIDVHPPH